MARAEHPSYKLEEGGIAYPRDVSFSSYLDTAERDFVRNLSASIYSSSPSRELPTPRASMGIKNRGFRNELGVFGAEKYFNEKVNDQNHISSNNVRSKQKHNIQKRDDFSEKKLSRSSNFSTTTTSNNNSIKSPSPSLKSERSWNNKDSQFGTSLKILSGLQCKATCFDKNSVFTNNTQQIIQPRPKLHKYDQNCYRKSKVSHQQEQFAFPIIDTASKSYTFVEDKPRKSIEIFGFKHVGKQEIAQNLERKLSILAWDAIPNSHNSGSIPNFSPTTKKNGSNVKEFDQDARSDASSDLFEIENLSGITDNTLNSYAPSEASIEWSVVTASAVEFYAVNDDRSDVKSVHSDATMRKMKVQQQKSLSGSGFLMACTSHKAVDVVRSFNNNGDNNTFKRNNVKGQFDLKGNKIVTPSRNLHALAYA